MMDAIVIVVWIATTAICIAALDYLYTRVEQAIRRRDEAILRALANTNGKANGTDDHGPTAIFDYEEHID